MPLIGRLVDRHGVRRVVLPAIVATALATAGLATAGSIAQFMLLYVVLGFASAGQTPMPYARAVSSLFDARSGLALGLAMAGVGMGAMLLPQLAPALITQVGWRAAYLGLAVLILAIALPAAGLFVHEAPFERATDNARTGTGAREALRTPLFWRLGAAFFLATV